MSRNPDDNMVPTIGGWQYTFNLNDVREGQAGTISGRIPHVGRGEMLLRSASFKSGIRYTVVPAVKMTVYYTLHGEGFVHSVPIWPEEYLNAIRTGRFGALRFTTLRVQGSRAIYSTKMKRLYYSPWVFV